MTDTPVPDVRELAAKAIGDWLAFNTDTFWFPGFEPQHCADAVLAAVTPVIRRQVAEEVAADFEKRGRDEYQNLAWMYADEAAAIARSHSTQPETGQDHG